MILYFVFWWPQGWFVYCTGPTADVTECHISFRSGRIEWRYINSAPVPVGARSKGEGVRLLFCWDCGFEFHRWAWMFVVSDVGREEEVSETGWSSARRSFTERDGAASTNNRPCPTRTSDPLKKSTARVYGVAMGWKYSINIFHLFDHVLNGLWINWLRLS
jgi:hypothetical protein